MYRSARSLQTTGVGLSLSLFLCGPAASQSPRFAVAVPISPTTADAPLIHRSCSSEAPELGAGVGAVRANPNPDAGCDTPAPAAPVADPCKTVSLMHSGCVVLQDPIPAQLSAIGKHGSEILQARGKVLGILESSNTCSAWYQEKDPDAAATFRMIRFDLDRKADGSVQESHGPGSLVVFRSPYVASVIQGDGANATITLNAQGAFFRVMARVVGLSNDGGPFEYRGQRTLRVGPYDGNTSQAQIVTLLHEFGHALDLLPSDENDTDGKSVRNTEEVLRHCHAEVDSKSKAK